MTQLEAEQKTGGLTYPQAEKRLRLGKIELLNKHDFYMAWVVIRREVRDSFRDWRIIIPILLLTLIFPLLTNIAAKVMLDFVADYGQDNVLIVYQLVPFLLLVVGFLPMSFSLVIALETFVGEKERKSLEPLLATPLTNTQLYMGKMAAAVVPPLAASYVGMLIYIIGLKWSIDWSPPLILLLQVILLSTIQGIVMVAAAVVISSQTTSVRASNLLASFIIVPMAMLVQLEAVTLFWSNFTALWWILGGLLVALAILVRMGIKLFNREELLGRDLDHIRLGWMFVTFWNRFTGRDENGRYPNPIQWFRQTFAVLPSLRQPAAVLMVALFAAVIFGVIMTNTYDLPPVIQAQLAEEQIVDRLGYIDEVASTLPRTIFFHNLRVIALSTILGVFTFGVLGIVIFGLPWALLSFVVAQVVAVGGDPTSFIVGTILPHALFELPALLIAYAAALRWHALIISPPPDRTVSESWLIAGAEFMRVMLGIVVPILLTAAFVEGLVTPMILNLVYG